MPDNLDGWTKWSQYVLKELESLNEYNKSFDKRLRNIETGLASLKTEFKVKSGIYGLVGSAIPVVIGLGIWALRSSGG